MSTEQILIFSDWEEREEEKVLGGKDELIFEEMMKALNFQRHSALLPFFRNVD